MKKRIINALAAAVSAASAASMTALTAFAEESSSSSAETATGSNPFFTLVLPLILMFAILYFMAIRPQKKQEQQLKDMQSSIEIGDEVVTSGGIIGIVVRKADDNIVIETGGERNKLRIKTWAIAENVSAKERAQAASGKKTADSPLAAAGLSSDDSEKKSKKKKKDEESE